MNLFNIMLNISKSLHQFGNCCFLLSIKIRFASLKWMFSSLTRLSLRFEGIRIFLFTQWSWVSANSLVSFLVHWFDIVWFNTSLLEKSEMFRMILIVGCNVLSIYAISEDLWIQFIVLETRETLNTMRNVQATINSTFERTENIGTWGCASKTNIQKATERAAVTLIVNSKIITNFSVASINFIQTHLGKSASSDKKAGAVTSSIIIQTDFDTIVSQFCRCSSSDNMITTDTGRNDLSQSELVRATNN